MIGIIDRWRARRDAEWWERHRRETRWSDLARYNSERHRGIVHTPEWQALMAGQQRQFDEEHGHGSVFPLRLDPE